MKYNIQYKGILIFITVMTVVFGLYGFNFNTAKAVINKQINYQGKLFTGTNTPVSDGGYNIKYRLYTTSTGGSPIWTETLCYSSDNGNTCDGTGTDNRVSVSNGLFSTMLGSVTSLDTVDFNQTLYLGVEIGGNSASSATWDGEMTPRKKIGAVPAAFEADKLDGLSSEQFIRSDADNATTSSSTFLNVIQNGAGKVAEFFGAGSASVLSILSDGKVGIGTTTPTDTLSVNGPIFLANTTPTATGNRLYANGGDLYYAGNLIGGASVGNWTSNGTDVWRPTGTVGVGTSTPFANFAINPIAGSASNQFVIGSSTATNFIVDNSGNIGVGTASPGAKLHITSTGSPFEALRLQNTTISQSVDLTFNSKDSGNTNRERARIKADTGNTTADGKLTFQVLRNLSEVDALTMIGGVATSEAFVGIGSSTPYAKLSVTNLGVNHSFVVEDSASPDTSPFVIDSAGLVGIGTSTPDTPLTIYSGTAVDKDAISAHGFNGSTAEKTMIRMMNGNRGYSWGIRFGAARDPFGGGQSGDAFVVNTKVNSGTESERFRISKDGYVGIGSTTPFSAALSVYNNATSKNVLLLDALSGTTVPILDVKLASTTQFVIGSTGNVGIGTSSPGSLLTLSQTISSATTKAGLAINGIYGGADTVQTIDFTINGYTGTPSARIGNPTNGSTGELSFYTNSNYLTTAPTEKVRITSAGNVGIGTTSPTTKLVLSGNSSITTLSSLDTAATISIENTNTTNDNLGTLAFRTNDANGTLASGVHLQSVFTSHTASAVSSDFLIQTRNAGSLTEKLRITAAGNVGIGTSTPSTKLSVWGTGSVLSIGDDTNTSTNMAIAGSRAYMGYDGTNAVLQGTSGKGIEFNVNNGTFGSGTAVTIDTSGNVGIGTTTPGQKLSVAGDILGNNFIGSYFTGTSTTVSTFNGPLNTSGTTGGYRIDNTLILQASSTNFSTLLGQSAGAATLADGLYNTAIGYQALMTATSTDGNTGVGYQALKANTVGTGNTALGYISLAANTTGVSNTAVGFRALRANTTGSYNVALGTYALDVNTTGGYNTSIGYATLLANTTGNYNTANGYEALLNNTTGSSNTASGYFSLAANTTGNYNTASGHISLDNNITGIGNTAIGYGSLHYNQSATSSTALGYAAGYGASGAYNNQGGVYIGYSSGYNAINGSDYNTLVGYRSGYGVTTGARNVFLGNSTIAASYNQVTTGSNNISIGNDVAVPSATTNNQLSIGNLIYGNGLDGTGATVSSGYIGIGSSTPYAKLAITNTGTNPSFVVEDSTSPDSSPFIIDASGNVGVGTAAPAGLLHISDITSNSQPTIRITNDARTWGLRTDGALSTDAFVIRDITNAADRLTIDGSGNVGIGTTIPDQLLNIYSASTDPVINITRNQGVALGTAFGSLRFTAQGGLVSKFESIASNALEDAAHLTFSTKASGGSLTEQMRITDAGNVGIGTTSPLARLDVAGANNGTSPLFQVSSVSAFATTSRFIVDSSGNVGIGTTTPGQKLEVMGIGRFDGTNTFSIGSDTNYNRIDTAGSGLEIFRFLSTGNNMAGIRAGSMVIGTAAPFLTATAPTQGLIVQGNIGIGSTSPLARLDVAGANNGTSPLFQVSSVSSFATTTRLIVDSSGNVGIGTTSPNGKFTVAGISVWPNIPEFEGNGASIGIKINNTSAGGRSFSILSSNAVAGAPSSLRFYDDASTTDRMVINASGNVGIGTSTPDRLLTVSGSTSATTTIETITANRTPGLEFRANVTGNNINIGNISFINSSSGNNTMANITGFQGSSATLGALIFNTRSATGYAERMRVDVTGNIGIGTTTPYANLSVLGGSTASDTLLALNNRFRFQGDGVMKWGVTANAGFLSWGATNAIVGSQSGYDLSLYANGGEKMKITTAGLVGISSTTPYASLSVTNTGTNPSFVVEDSTSPDSSPFIIDASGNVGIGTTAPANALQVEGVTAINTANSFTATVLSVKRNTTMDSGGTGTVALNIFGRAGQTADLFQIGATSATDDLLTFTAAGNLGIGSTSPYASLAITNTGTNPSFVVEDSTSPDTTPFIIDASGNVGVGTSSPDRLLTVSGSTSATTTIETVTANRTPGLELRANVTGNNINIGNISFINSSSGNSTMANITGFQGASASLGALIFNTRSATGYAERMRVDITGNIGIGSTSPYAQFSLGGNSTSKTLFALDAISGQTQPILDIKLASTTKFIISSGGNVGIGTTSPYAALSVLGNVVATNFSATSTTATSTFAGGVDFGSGNFTYDTYTGVTSINSLQTGNMNFETDAGQVSWADMALSSTPSDTPVGYTAFLNGSSTISVYGLSAGNGWLKDDYPRVAIGSTTAPSSKLTVFGNGTGTNGTFEVVNSASTTLMKILDNGSVGIASTSPWKTFSVNGTVAMNGLTSSATGNALCITTSKEITDAGGASCTPSSIRFKENVSPMQTGYALDLLSKLSIVDFDYIERQQYETNHSYGMIAEDVEKIDKNLVDYGYDGKPVSLHFEKITGLLVQAVQEQEGKIGDISSTTSRLDLTSSQLVASNALNITNLNSKIDVLNDMVANLNASTTLIAKLASSTADMLASSTETSLLNSTSFMDKIFLSFTNYLTTAMTKVKGIFVNEIHIEDKLCVDDVCINKDQLKTLIIQATASSTNNTNNNQVNIPTVPNNNPVVTLPPATPDNGTTTQTQTQINTQTQNQTQATSTTVTNNDPTPAPQTTETPTTPVTEDPTPAPTPVVESTPVVETTPTAPVTESAPAPAPAGESAPQS